MWLTRIIPINLGLAAASLGVQVFLLYPWHAVVSQKIEQIQQDQNDLIEENQRSYSKKLLKN